MLFGRALVRLAVALVFALSMVACAGAPQTTTAQGADISDSPTKTAREARAGRNDSPAASIFTEGDYKIGVDDVLQVSVWRNPELNVTVPVRPDGKVSLPLIGDVQAGGLTPVEVSRHIESRLRRYIRSPNVAVILTELHSHEFLSRVRVTGAVETPISIPYRQGMGTPFGDTHHWVWRRTLIFMKP